jgi:pectin methylesterase-like acyl-CoA thioesterase
MTPPPQLNTDSVMALTFKPPTNDPGYFDDDWVGTTPGTDPGAEPATNFGCDSFATIQAAVTAVTSGGTVVVNAGTDMENVTVIEPLTLTGAGEASVTLRLSVSDPNCGGGRRRLALHRRQQSHPAPSRSVYSYRADMAHHSNAVVPSGAPLSNMAVTPISNLMRPCLT